MIGPNLLKITVIAAAILMSCNAFAQEQELDDEIIATIESDDPETLELFMDWSSSPATVLRLSMRIAC